jgi:hypothetical protein
MRATPNKKAKLSPRNSVVFPETCTCGTCGGSNACMGMYASEDSTETNTISKLYQNKGKAGSYWITGKCSIAIYFCKDCLAATAKYTQE